MSLRYCWGFAIILRTLCEAQAGSAFDLQGHRGARAIYPENTLKAFEYAIAVGVNTLEMDLQITRDREVVISHDPFVNADLCLDQNNKRLKKNILIHSVSLKEVQNFDCGTIPNSRFPKQRQLKQKIPTLDQVFDLVERSLDPRARVVSFNIETKIVPGHPEYSLPPKEFVELVLRTVRRHHMVERTFLQSFDHRTLVIAKQLEPKLKIAALVAENFPNLGVLAKDLHPDVISPHFDWITKETVTELHGIGIRVIPWTVNTPEDWKRMLGIGVDGIITDDPEGLRRYLDHQK